MIHSVPAILAAYAVALYLLLSYGWVFRELVLDMLGDPSPMLGGLFGYAFVLAVFAHAGGLQGGIGVGLQAQRGPGRQ